MAGMEVEFDIDFGFKKCDPDRWEFTNNGFIKGQKQFLKIIPRRKSSQLNSQQNQSDQTDTSPSSCVEVESFGPWEEVEILKKDKNVVMQELAILRHNQQGADGKLHLLGQRLQGMEISQQQMLSFLAMVVQSPGFLGQLLQQNESNWRISGTNKKRPFIALEQGTEGDEPVASDGQIVRYQPLIHNWDGSQQYDHSPDGLDDLFETNDMVSEEHMPVLMEEDGNFEKEGQFVFPDLLEDGMLEKLLLASPSVETTEQSQNLDRLTEELRLLVSETNNPDGEI
ncbi:hypothetical protein IFM89_020852 [Coptis chinensis]|uniref:Uncharacterized protein n=1 Tax=Coptis chinensis TaxID=261450 RepID=A0A835IXF5_9MAGN|nr:hypothetical protein IFM89_020852 [Coptis chinensis]